jgi:hypothetical protein
MPTSTGSDASEPRPGPRSPATRLPAADGAEQPLADHDDFGAVFDRYFVEIHGYAARRVGRDAAADIAADTFLTAFRLRRKFDPGWADQERLHLGDHRRGTADPTPSPSCIPLSARKAGTPG